jgi:hypothetical protein
MITYEGEIKEQKRAAESLQLEIEQLNNQI